MPSPTTTAKEAVLAVRAVAPFDVRDIARKAGAELAGLFDTLNSKALLHADIDAHRFLLVPRPGEIPFPDGKQDSSNYGDGYYGYEPERNAKDLIALPAGRPIIDVGQVGGGLYDLDVHRRIKIKGSNHARDGDGQVWELLFVNYLRGWFFSGNYLVLSPAKIKPKREYTVLLRKPEQGEQLQSAPISMIEDTAPQPVRYRTAVPG
jgi:hypothetical protein